MAHNDTNRSVEERRSARRASVELVIQYVNLEQFCQDYARNLSLGGIFIESGQPLPVGSPLELTFQLPGYEGAVRTTGRVVRVVSPDSVAGKKGRPGMAVQFEDLSEEHKAIIDALVQAAFEEE